VLPDVPTVSEAAIPGFGSGRLARLFRAAGTPREIVERIAREAARSSRFA